MRIALVTQFFPPEPCAAANRAEAMASALERAGHAVTIVTAFPSFPQGRLQQSDRFRLQRTQPHNGGEIVRLLTVRFGRMPGARLAHWLVTAFSFSAYLLFSRRRFDAIVITVPPITLALPAFAGVARHRAKLVLDVRDVFPDIALAMGEWRAGGFLARVTESVARSLYRTAELIVAVTPTAISQIARRGVDARRLMLAPNGAMEASWNPASPVESGFVALYAGNLGLATDVDVLADAALLLRESDAITIDVVGDGAQAERLKARIARQGIEHIRIRSSVARSEAMQMLASAGAAIIPLRAGITESIPTKIFDALSVGCPVVVAGEGEAAATAVASGAGIAVAAGDACALVQALRSVASFERETRRSWAERGRAFVNGMYRRDAIMDRLCARLAEL